ncbi:MAG: ABC transporter permease subunit [Bacillus subtilis]|nr:ABC transporter permease subunit [Bacillus subtilis]
MRCCLSQTQLAISSGVMFGGAPLMESIFNYPGIGQAFSQAIAERDYYVVQGILLFVSVIVIGVNLVADMIYSLIDPRIRRSA